MPSRFKHLTVYISIFKFEKNEISVFCSPNISPTTVKIFKRLSSFLIICLIFRILGELGENERFCQPKYLLYSIIQSKIKNLRVFKYFEALNALHPRTERPILSKFY